MSIQINHPFLIQLLLFLLLKLKLLYIDISSLSDIRSANILCHPVGCLLASLIVSFAAYFNFVKFQFNFLSLAFFLISYVRLWLTLGDKGFLPGFLSRVLQF